MEPEAVVETKEEGTRVGIPIHEKPTKGLFAVRRRKERAVCNRNSGAGEMAD